MEPFIKVRDAICCTLSGALMLMLVGEENAKMQKNASVIRCEGCDTGRRQNHPEIAETC